MKRVVIVGGGVAGLVTAISLQKSAEITVIEKGQACGGLLRSFTNTQGISFDYGTHLISETGNAAIDSLLFDRLQSTAWQKFQIARAGSYFSDKLYSESPFIDIRTLSADLYAQAVVELLQHNEPDGELTDSRSQLLDRFGPIITEHVYAPISRRQFDCDLSELSANNPFLPRRIIAFDPFVSRELKRSPFFDQKLSFNSFNEGVGTTHHYYPYKDGIGQWVTSLVDELDDLGVQVRTNSFVTEILHEDGRVNGVRLNDDKLIECDHLVWTAPPFLLLKGLGVPFKSSRLKARPVGLFHFVFDRPFLIDNHFVTSYQENLKTFRVTLYPNLQNRCGVAPFNCTVEVIGSAGDAFHTFEGAVIDELIQMGILDKDAQRLSLDLEVVPVGFPALTHDFMDTLRGQVAQVYDAFDNIMLAGRAKSDPFFAREVMADSYYQAKQLEKQWAS